MHLTIGFVDMEEHSQRFHSNARSHFASVVLVHEVAHGVHPSRLRRVDLVGPVRDHGYDRVLRPVVRAKLNQVVQFVLASQVPENEGNLDLSDQPKSPFWEERTCCPWPELQEC